MVIPQTGFGNNCHIEKIEVSAEILCVYLGIGDTPVPSLSLYEIV